MGAHNASVESGVNRDVDLQTGEDQGHALVGDLLALGALKVQDDVEVIEEAGVAKGGLEKLPVKEALDAINGTFDLDLLKSGTEPKTVFVLRTQFPSALKLSPKAKADDCYRHHFCCSVS